MPISYNKNIVSNQGADMIRCMTCFVAGVVVATIGFSGVASLLDSGVDAVKTQAQELSGK
jgi:hypothetical protein